MSPKPEITFLNVRVAPLPRSPSLEVPTRSLSGALFRWMFPLRFRFSRPPKFDLPVVTSILAPKGLGDEKVMSQLILTERESSPWLGTVASILFVTVNGLPEIEMFGLIVGTRTESPKINSDKTSPVMSFLVSILKVVRLPSPKNCRDSPACGTPRGFQLSGLLQLALASPVQVRRVMAEVLMIEPISKATKQRRINQPVSRGIWQTKRCLIVASETVGDLTSGTGWELKLKVLIFSLVSLFRFCIGLATGHTNLRRKSAGGLQNISPAQKIFGGGFLRARHSARQGCPYTTLGLRIDQAIELGVAGDGIGDDVICAGVGWQRCGCDPV